MGRNEKILVGLDVGSTKVVTIIAAVRENGPEPIGIGIAESKGLKKGVIVSLEATVESIKKSVAEAEKMAMCEAEQVYVGVAGSHIKSLNSKGVTPVASRSREIDEDDIRRVIETARAVTLSPDREVVHIVPQEFMVDDQEGIGDPHGMIGTRLEANVHIVTASATALQNIVTAVNRSGLQVADTVLEPLAIGDAMIHDDERELGCVLVDIGGGKTNVAVYCRGAVRHTVVVPIGGEHFTNDIAVGLRTTIQEAERLKREHGCALPVLVDPEKVIEVTGAGQRQARMVSQQVLGDIIQPRAEEIVNMIRSEIRSGGFERQCGAGAVITGGGALLRGFPEMAEDLLDMPVRVGVPQAGGNARLKSPEFATAVGLVAFADRRRKSHDFHEGNSFGFRKLIARFRGML